MNTKSEGWYTWKPSHKGHVLRDARGELIEAGQVGLFTLLQAQRIPGSFEPAAEPKPAKKR